jgi:hypothetical protein
MGDSESGVAVVCTTCSWDAVYPTRETAEHAKRVHERTNGHEVAIGDDS